MLQQLEQLRAEEKELKKKKKEEKAKLKAERMKTMKDCESSSSSSESSESECGEVIDMSSLSGEVPTQPILEGLQPSAQGGVAVLTRPSSVSTHQEDKCCTGTSTSCDSIDSVGHNNASSSSSVVKKIEVCMGKKCKTSGGGALLEEFERLMGVEGSVVECKCMGKCKNGPNVRVLNSEEGIEDSVRNPTNPLYIGVGVEDVSLIVASLMGEVTKDLGLLGIVTAT